MKKEERDLIISAFCAGVLVGIALIMAALLFIRNVVDAYGADGTIEITTEYDYISEYIEITEGPESAVEILPELEDLGEFKITYYCACKKCNGKWGAVDRYGDPLVWGTVAVDPSVITLQTHLVIDGYDADFVARDTGGKWVRGKHIDVFVPVSHKEALKMAQGEKLRVWRVK